MATNAYTQTNSTWSSNIDAPSDHDSETHSYTPHSYT
jgi:hypothetical protein